MKNIGRTDTGNRLVEMSNVEFDAIQLLIQVADGKVLKQYDNDIYTATPYTRDVASLINAVMEWVETASRANELRHLADRIDMAIKVPENPEKGTQNV